MQFSLTCDSFARLSAICEWMPDGWPQPYLRAMLVERRSNKLIVVVTNVKLAVIEMVNADCPGPDEHCFIAFDSALIAQARAEASFSSTISFVVMRDMHTTIAETLFGYTHPSNVGVFPTEDKVETINWRRWLPDELPKVSYGHMQMDCPLLGYLAAAAPSKQIVFPPFIDTRIPALVRDKTDPNWFGLFMPSFDLVDKSPKLRIPTW